MKRDPINESMNGASGWRATPMPRICPACGTATRRDSARFCATCGRGLEHTSYAPADAVRASYHHHQPTTSKGTTTSDRPDAQRTNTPRLYAARQDDITATAFAFVAYALVPYLGIIFCPGAIICGGIGLLRARREDAHAGDDARRAAYVVACGFLVLGVQIFLWWILYKVPQWSRG